MIRFLALFTFAALLAPCAFSAEAPHKADAPHKYDIKSGIITFERVETIPLGSVSKKEILYFDDYGAKESKETFQNDVNTKKVSLQTVRMVIGGIRYIFSPQMKTGTKAPYNGQGVNPRYDLDERKMKEQYKVQLLGSETICGKPCKVASASVDIGDMKCWGWNHIMLKMELKNPNTSENISFVATKIEENVKIPKSKFEVPKDVSWE